MSAVSYPSFGLPRSERTAPGGEARYPFLRWSDLLARLDWQQGQHVLSVGGTGSGKTTLMALLLRMRRLVVVYVSKGMDETLSGPLFRSYVRYTDWPPKGGSKKPKTEKVMLWPKNGKDIRETREIKKEVFIKASNDILLHVGHWCIALDEIHYLSNLGLDTEMEDLEEQGRSANISLWGNTQRPANIPLAFYTNCSHAFFFLTQEEYDIRRLGSIRNKHTNPKQLIWNIERLDPHEFVYIDRSGRIPPVRSIVER